jgi:hypothetical protein
VFAVQWLLAHSHTASALYLGLGVAGVLVVALAPVESSPRDADEPALLSWAALAGLATAGLILARPDGLAYAAIPASLLACAWLRRASGPRMLAAFFVPAVVFPSLVMASTFTRFGLWVVDDKLDGATALGLLLLLGALPLVAYAVRRSLGGRFLDRDLALALVLVLTVAAGLLAVLVDSQQAAETLSNMRVNLLYEGENGPMWYFLALVLAVSIIAGLWIEDRAVRWLTAAFLQFFAVGIAVHVLTHPGRIGWGDSFNRASFHIVAVGFMVLGTSALAAMALVRSDEIAADEVSPAAEDGNTLEA